MRHTRYTLVALWVSVWIKYLVLCTDEKTIWFYEQARGTAALLYVAWQARTCERQFNAKGKKSGSDARWRSRLAPGTVASMQFAMSRKFYRRREKGRKRKNCEIERLQLVRPTVPVIYPLGFYTDPLQKRNDVDSVFNLNICKSLSWKFWHS